ncbi:hypothetical protein [Streptomyces sp. NPDC054838]
MNEALGVEAMKRAEGSNYNTIVPTMTAVKKLPDWIQLPSWWTPSFNPGGAVRHPVRGPDAAPIRRKHREVLEPGRDTHRRLEGLRGGDKLYGIPCVSSNLLISGVTYRRRDILEPRGIKADQVKSADDLMSLGKELTDAKRGVWAFGDLRTYLYTSWGAPAQVEDGQRQAGPPVRDPGVPKVRLQTDLAQSRSETSVTAASYEVVVFS